MALSYSSNWHGDTSANSISAEISDLNPYAEGSLLLNLHWWWYDFLTSTPDYLNSDGYGYDENGWIQHVDDGWTVGGSIVGHVGVGSRVSEFPDGLSFGWDGDPVRTTVATMVFHGAPGLFVREVEHATAGEAGPVAVASLSHQVTSPTGQYVIVFVVSDSGLDHVPDGAEDVLLADIGSGQEVRVLFYREGTPLVELEAGGGLIRYVAYVVVEGDSAPRWWAGVAGWA